MIFNIIYDLFSCVLIFSKGYDIFLWLLRNDIHTVVSITHFLGGLDFLSMPLALCSPLDNLLTRLRVSRLTAFSASNERRYSSSSPPPPPLVSLFYGTTDCCAWCGLCFASGRQVALLFKSSSHICLQQRQAQGKLYTKKKRLMKISCVCLCMLFECMLSVRISSATQQLYI